MSMTPPDDKVDAPTTTGGKSTLRALTASMTKKNRGLANAIRVELKLSKKDLDKEISVDDFMAVLARLDPSHPLVKKG